MKLNKLNTIKALMFYIFIVFGSLSQALSQRHGNYVGAEYAQELLEQNNRKAFEEQINQNYRAKLAVERAKIDSLLEKGNAVGLKFVSIQEVKAEILKVNLKPIPSKLDRNYNLVLSSNRELEQKIQSGYYDEKAQDITDDINMSIFIKAGFNEAAKVYNEIRLKCLAIQREFLELSQKAQLQNELADMKKKLRDQEFMMRSEDAANQSTIQSLQRQLNSR